MNEPFKDETLLARWLSGELTTEERQQVEAHPDFAQWERIIREADRLKLPPYDEEKAWQGLQSKQQGQQHRIRQMRILRIAGGIAAAVAVLIVLYLLFPRTEHLIVPAGEQLAFTFPDGSSVVLNAGSSLRFTPGQWRRIRRVTLNGEAFFEVVSGSPFEVNTEQGIVRVLGTSFNVFSRDKAFRVACFEGTVETRSTANDPEPEVLQAGDGVLYNGIAKRRLDQPLQERPDWLLGEISYTDTPLTEVFQEAERQFGIKIDYNGPNLNYNGPLSLKDPNLALRVVCESMNLSFTFISDKEVQIVAQ